MQSAFDSLERILSQEKKNRFADVTVIGGLDKFMANWLQQFPKETPEVHARMAATAEALKGYHALAPAERGAAVQRALDLILRPAEAKPGRAKATAVAPAPPARSPARVKPPAPAVEPGEDLDEGEEEQELVPAPRRMMNMSPGFGIDAEVTKLQNVGIKFAAKLERLGIHTVRDLLYHFPHRYDDYSRLNKISELLYGQEATVIATVLDCKARPIRNHLHITNVLLGDQTGTLPITFFNQPFLAKSLRQGMKIVMSGRVDRTGNRLTFVRPTWEPLTQDLLHTGRIVPVYPLTEGITNRWLRKLERDVVQYWADKVPDPLPPALREKLSLMNLAEALLEIHFPTSWEKNEAARRRLAFEEFLLIQIGVLRQRAKWQMEKGQALRVGPTVLDSFLQSLPFRLTRAQNRALNEILSDLRKPVPMSRLLQGDVGSGKTVVAAVGLLMAIASGAQGVLLAPTEILAEQHFKTLTRILSQWQPPAPDLQPRLGLLIGSLKAREKETVRAQLASGEINIAIGTHALIQEEVTFHDLALAIIDEQHRFGVAQRAAIRQKGFNPHLLVMSATPIPRTLALTVYGDLDLSIIDELPPGRQEIKTKWLTPGEREGAYSFIRKQVAAGRQAFVICPLIEESEAIDAKAAVEEYERLRTEVYPDLRLGLVHGKLKPAEKDQAMTQFRDGALDILVATSVVEVGIDVPNATVMLIEGADRFGLAQLHQFRGRVGRGADKSYCLLLAEKKESASDQRLQVIETTHDGFKLAEEDLKMRGPGEFFGTRQSGLPDLRVAKLSDVKLLELARQTAQEFFVQDPGLVAPEHRLLAENVRHFWHGEGDLS